MRQHLFRPALLKAVVQESLSPVPSLAMKQWFMNCYLELSKADRQGDQSVFEEIQVLEVDQTAKVGWQLLQFVLTQVQLHQVDEAAEIRLGRKERTPEPGVRTLVRQPRSPQLRHPGVNPDSAFYQRFPLQREQTQ